MNERPKVSIVMPSLNVVDYIQECIESVINQTLKDIEIICVDAGSTDGTLEILQNFATTDSRIRLIISEKKSYGYQMNLGLEAANGEYVGIVETDDYVPENMYEDLYKIASNERLDFVKADFYRFTHDESGNLVLDYNKLSENPSYYGRTICPEQEQIVFSFIMNTWSGIYDLNFLKKNNIRHNETPGASFQDTGFWFQTFCCADRVQFINRPYYMNRRDNPNSSVYNRNKIFCVCDEFDYIYDFLNKDQRKKSIFLPMYQFQRYKGYMASLNRSADEFKLDFLRKFREDYLYSLHNGELDDSKFPPGAKKTLWDIMKDPDDFYNILQNDDRAKTIVQSASHLMYKVKDSLFEVGFKGTVRKAIQKLRSKNG